jgi:hypothetical protein
MKGNPIPSPYISLILGIPSKKKKTKVKGKVVWSNLEGFGVKFLGSKKK